MKLKRLLVILPFLTVSFGQSLVPLDSLPTGLVYLTRSATGAITWEGVKLGPGLELQTANGERVLVATQVPLLGLRVDWSVPLKRLTDTTFEAVNEPYQGRAIVVQIAPNGVLTLMSTGFTITGRVFTLAQPIPAGTVVTASFFW